MGTRGVMGFVVNGEEKLAYNHYDSYPSGVGADILEWLRAQDIGDLKGMVSTLRVIDGETPPTPEDVERLEPWTDLGVSSQSTDDWYCLLRRTQGDLGAMVTAGVIEDGSAFPRNSLFCEWGYVVDVDAGVLEVYQGFQQAPHQDGRFAGRGGTIDGYEPVRLVASWPLADLPSTKEFIAIECADEDGD